MIVNLKRDFIKLTVFIYMIYLFWYSQAIGDSNILLYGGMCFIFVAYLFYINGRSLKNLKISKGIIYWIMYGIFSLIVGIVVAYDKGILLSSLFTFFAFIFLCVCITTVSIIEQDLWWFIKDILIICIFCALYTIFRGYDYYNGIIVITMGPKNNPNTLGALMVFGMFAVMYREKKGFTQLMTSFIIIALFLYIIILTGSKKALFSGAIFLLVWGIGFMKYMRDRPLYYKFTTLFLLFLIFILSFYYLSTIYINTASFARMATLFTSGSTNMRRGMYKESLDFFMNNPMFGIGYDQFKVISQYKKYSHSTYAEVLANGGLIGILLFFTPIVLAGIKLFQNRKKDSSYRVWMYISLYLVEIFLGSVNIFMYDFTHLMIWTIIFVYVDFGLKFNKKSY